MSTEPQLPGFPLLTYAEVQTGRTVRGPTLLKLASAFDLCATARSGRCASLDNLAAGTYRASYTRSNSSVKVLRVAWYYRVPRNGSGGAFTTGDTVSVSLTMTDAGGHSVGPSDARIPAALAGTNVVATAAALFDNPAGSALGGVGWIDLDAIADELTQADWSLDFTIAVTTLSPLYVDRIEVWEVPRGLVSDADGVGALLAPLSPGNPIAAGTTSTEGLERIAVTAQAAVRVPRTYLSLSWINDTTATIPQTTASSFAALTNFEESSGVPMQFVVRVRPVYVAAPPGSNAGESARFRVLYYVAGGGTADVRLNTGASTSPFTATGLTGASWQWSSWITAKLPTDGSGQLATLTVEGQVDTGTLYIAGIDVVENVS